MPSVAQRRPFSGGTDGGTIEAEEGMTLRSVKSRSGAQLASALDTSSLDVMRLILLEVKQATSLKRFDERPEASDARIRFAVDLVTAGRTADVARSSKAVQGLLQAWDMADGQRQGAILPLPIYCLSNLIALLGAHQPNHEYAEEIIHALLPSKDVQPESGAGQSYWHRLQMYLSEAGVSSKSTKENGKHRASSSAASDELILATLHLLLAITSFAGGKYARTVFDNMSWSMRSLPRLANMRKRVAERKRDGKKVATSRGKSVATLATPDIRTLWSLVLLSFLRSSAGGCTTVTLRIASLSLGRDFYPAILRGLTHDPAQIVAHILMGLHDGLLSDEASVKLPRSKVVNLFNEWTCKELVSLYERETDVIRLVQSDEEHSIADVAHHFLLALCTHPGRGVCYVDEGWYGRQKDVEDDEEREEGGSDQMGIYNKVLLGVLRSLSFTRSPKQGELALRILAASPELSGPYLRTLVSIDPKATSISWLSAATFLGRALSLPLPSFQDENSDWLPSPPPAKACIDALLPAPIARSMLARGIGSTDRLTRMATLSLLARVIARLLAFRHVCQQASKGVDDPSPRDLDDDTVDVTDRVAVEDVLSGLYGLQARGKEPWQTRWEEVLCEARERLLDASALLATVSDPDQRPAKSQVQGHGAEDANPTSRDTALLETTLRDCWLLQELYQDHTALSTGDLVQLFDFILAERGGAENGLAALSRLHAMRAVSVHTTLQSGSMDIFFRASSSSTSYLARLLHLQSESKLAMLRTASQTLIRSAMLSSVLFEHDQDEWQAWEYAMQEQGPDLFDFIDESVLRCLKTPYRYVEIARRATEGPQEGTMSTVDLVASPLLFTMLEQYSIRTRKNLFQHDEIHSAFLNFLGRLLLALLTLGRSANTLIALLDECAEALTVSHAKDREMLLSHSEGIRHAILGLKRDEEGQRSSSSETISPSDQRSASLHPVSNNAFATGQVDAALSAQIFATHLAYAARLTKKVDWTAASSTDARLVLLAAAARIQDGKDVAQTVIFLVEAIQQGGFSRHLLHQGIFGNQALLSLAQNNDDLLSGLIGLVCEGPFQPENEEDCQMVVPVIEMILDKAAAADEAHIWSFAVQLTPFMETSSIHYLLRMLLSHGGHLDLLSEVVQNVKGTTITVRDMAALVSTARRSSEIPIVLALITRSSATAEDDFADVERLLNFVVEHSDAVSADAALCQLLTSHPGKTQDIFENIASAAGSIDLAKRLPFAFAQACHGARLEEIELSTLFQACASQIFASDKATGIAFARACFILMQHAPADVIGSLRNCIPEPPAKAFNFCALLIASRIAQDKHASVGAAEYLHALSEKALLWLVRRFAEDEEENPDTIEGLQAFVDVLSHETGMLPSLAHLVEPVLTAAIRRRLGSPLHAELVRILLTSTTFKSWRKQQYIDEMLHSRAALADPKVRQSVISATVACIEQDYSVASASLVAALVPLYGGSLDLNDRQIFQVFFRFEHPNKTPLLGLLSRWKGDTGVATPGQVDDELIWRLEPNRVLETCLKFPRARTFTDLKQTGYEQDELNTSLRSMYDPLLLLLIFAQFLARDRPPTGFQLINMLRTNVLGCVVCCLSSRSDPVRKMAMSLLAKTYSFVDAAEFHEKAQLLLLLDALRSSLSSNTDAYLPLTTTLFVAHALRAQAQPSLYLYPLISRFLLQRSAPLDPTDVPLLYSFLFASSHQTSTHRQQRIFILRYLTACVRFGGRAEWRIMKRRHVWHSACSLYNAACSTSSSDAGLRHAIEELWEAGSQKQHVVLHAVVRLGFLEYVQQIFALHPAALVRERTYWLRVLCNTLLTVDMSRLHEASGGTWSASLSGLFESLAKTEMSDEQPLLPSEKQTLQLANALLKMTNFLNDDQTGAALILSRSRLAEKIGSIAHILVTSVLGHVPGDADNRLASLEPRSPVQVTLVRTTLAVVHQITKLGPSQATETLLGTARKLAQVAAPQ